MKKIIVNDVTSGTLSNIEGTTLFSVLDSVIKVGDTVVLSFEGINTISSSFLNSSIGSLVDKYGFEVLKDKVKITSYTKPLSDILLNYISNLRANFIA